VFNDNKRGISAISWREQEEFEETKGVIRIRKSKRDRQHKGQKKKKKRINNDLRKTTQNTKDRGTRTPLNIGGELRCPGSCPSSIYGF
jgi:hypothetical protein